MDGTGQNLSWHSSDLNWQSVYMLAHWHTTTGLHTPHCWHRHHTLHHTSQRCKYLTSPQIRIISSANSYLRWSYLMQNHIWDDHLWCRIISEMIISNEEFYLRWLSLMQNLYNRCWGDHPWFRMLIHLWEVRESLIKCRI